MKVGDGDKFPGALTGLQKKYYDITISISEENVKQGSQVFNATKISKPLEISATNSPGTQTSIQINSTAVPTVSLYNLFNCSFFQLFFFLLILFLFNNRRVQLLRVVHQQGILGPRAAHVNIINLWNVDCVKM